MNTCPHCESELSPNALVCPHCGCMVRDKSNFLLNLMAFLFPLPMLLYAALCQQRMPLRMSGLEKWCLIGFVVKIVLCAVLCVVCVGAVRDFTQAMLYWYSMA